MEKLIIKHYHSDNLKCISDYDTDFYEQEILNSIILSTFNKEQPTSCCSVVINKEANTLIFALFALENSFLYASGISSTISKDLHVSVVNLLLQDFLSMQFPFKMLHSFEPALPIIIDALKTYGDRKLECLDSAWSCDIEQVKWTSQPLVIRNDEKTILRKASMTELPLVKEWTKGFLDHYSMGDGIDVDEMCRQELLKDHIYILYQDSLPVSMSWKRRPLRNTCALAYVYTPPEYRHKGFGKVCVAMLTEVILTDYKYATLFVHGTQDPHNNLYSTIGYRLLGKAARYAVA